MSRRRIAFVAALVALAATVSGQTAEAPKPLSDVQKLTVVASRLQWENAQLRELAARREFEALLKSLQVAGFTLDLQTLTYAPIPKPAK